ncbi:MAG: prolyl oligopeptidase family serine peptidase [Ilumatobacteraceae bacterium]
MSDTFPRQHARTQRLTLGEPRSFTVSPDGARVVFARSHGGSDPVNTLWVLETASGTEREVFDPRALPVDGGELTAEERRRRERAREGASGVVTYSCDADVTCAATVIGGQVVHVRLDDGTVTVPEIAPGVFDVRISPDGTHLAYVRGDALCVAPLSGVERVIARETSETVTWGSADFIAAEEMGRQRGFWWSPDSRTIAACRVDTDPIVPWWIADPAHPEQAPVEHRYPAAGTANALVSLALVDVATGDRTDVDLGDGWEYLNSVSWTAAGLIAQVQTRDQRMVHVRRIDPATGDSDVIFSDYDEHWVELVPGVPTLESSGRLVTCVDRGGLRRLLVDGAVMTPESLQVRGVAYAGETVLFTANDPNIPRRLRAWRLDTSSGNIAPVSPDLGVASVVGNSAATVTRHASLADARASFHVVSEHGGADVANLAETPLVSPNVTFHEVGDARIPVAILTPRDGRDTPLPVLFDPYGGPHAQRVVETTGAFATSQWFADQGFVVVVADNAGTPGRGSDVERAVWRDLAGPVLADQVAVARALPHLEPRADISRVAVRGWSFGGYLAALAVLHAPDVFHAGVAGAPVTDWALYDTHYTERYLGRVLDDAAYTSTSLLHDAEKLTRPLLLIHGLADDNVVAAHTLQLSSALLAAGRTHEVLPLSGVTHMTPQEVVAENLLLHQLDFIRRSLG